MSFHSIPPQYITCNFIPHWNCECIGPRIDPIRNPLVHHRFLWKVAMGDVYSPSFRKHIRNPETLKPPLKHPYSSRNPSRGTSTSWGSITAREITLSLSSLLVMMRSPATSTASRSFASGGTSFFGGMKSASGSSIGGAKEWYRVVKELVYWGLFTSCELRRKFGMGVVRDVTGFCSSTTWMSWALRTD